MVVRLCSYYLAPRWAEIDAHYHASPVPLLRMRGHRLLSMVYAWAIERIPSDKLDDWLVEMNDLLPWQDIESEAAINLESESFFAAQAKGGR